MKLIVTGSAGFIGMHTALGLLGAGHEVIGVDNLNTYYDVQLKQRRLELLQEQPGFRFYKLDIADSATLHQCFKHEGPERVVHLAAQAGVRYSLENPMAYVSSNLVGFANILEACRQAKVPHLVFASSSSVYGDDARLPFSEHNPADHPLSLYAATKRSNELMAHAYAHLYGLRMTGLRFFTVYGPWGRPDMAPILFAKAIVSGDPIRVHNHGNHRRDFTYVDDIVRGVVAVALGSPPAGPTRVAGPDDPATGNAPFRLYNIGNGNPVRLMDFLSRLEHSLGRKALLEMIDAQPG
ncbi:MAG: NAD-dependent epimerase/dehydratase family protein, partial [Lysobacterales bacterium]